jgi:hypothetical protein
VTGPVARPGHPGDHHSVLGAADPGSLRLDEAPDHPQVEVSPATAPLTAVLPGAPPPALAAPLHIPRRRQTATTTAAISLQFQPSDSRKR